MSKLRFACVKLAVSGMAVAAALTTTPASAQFFLQSRDMKGAAIADGDANVGQPLPGATSAELRAALTWNMRAALNVAALQCQFEPTLLTVDYYNATIRDHNEELKGAFDTLVKYFERTSKTKALGQTALDQFGTRTYSGFATVAAQLNFCQTASTIGRDAVFTPRGGFSTLAQARTRELRNSLLPYGEQRLPFYIGQDRPSVLPRLDALCWNKKAQWQAKKCGAPAWAPVEALAAN